MVLGCNGSEAQVWYDVKKMSEKVYSIIWSSAACSDLVNGWMTYWLIKLGGCDDSLGLQAGNIVEYDCRCCGLCWER